MDDVARAMMELVSYAQKQYMATIDIARELISIESCLEQISTRLVEVIGEQRRLADAWENPSAPSNNTGGGSMTASDGALALQELRRRGFLVERVEKDGAVRLSLKPQSRVTELDLAFTRRWKDAILGELREDYASAPRRRVDHLHHARVVPAARLDREAVSPVVGSGDAARRQDTLADGIASMGADDPALPRRDCERLGAWDYLKACVYEMAEGWDALPERTRRSEDFEKITRALDEWVLTYSVGDYWGFSREAFDARGAQFRAVCREVMGDVLTRRPAPGAEPPERMDALTLLEEHAYFDPAPKVGLAAPSGLVSGTGPATESTAGSTAVGTSA